MRNRFYEEIVFSLDTYNGNRDVMWIDISKQLQVLTRAGYISKVYSDDDAADIIVIQFHEQDEELASGVCEWVTWDELTAVEAEREEVIREDEE